MKIVIKIKGDTIRGEKFRLDKKNRALILRHIDKCLDVLVTDYPIAASREVTPK